MTPTTIFQLQLVLGYVAWLLCFATYIWPRLRAMEPVSAHRSLAALHSFRFFGLVFLIPGVVGPRLPPDFAVFAAYWDLATAVLAMLALLTVRIKTFFWFFVLAYNLVGMLDLILDYSHAMRIGLPQLSGQLGAAYAIPIIFVPLLLITHVAAVRLLFRHGHIRRQVRAAGSLDAA